MDNENKEILLLKPVKYWRVLSLENVCDDSLESCRDDIFVTNI